MDLFSVACITCRAKIQVRSVAAIGQVLACPRCGGMVEITAPPGWKPPAAPPEKQPAKQLAKQSPKGDAAASGAIKSPVHPTPPTHPQPAGESAKPADPAATGDYVGVAQPVLDDDDPLAVAARQAEEQQRKQRKLLVVGGALVGLALAAMGIRYAVSKPDEVAENPPHDVPPVASVTPSATPSSTPPRAIPTPSPVAVPTPTPTAAPTPSATPSATPAATPSATPTGTVVAKVGPPPAKPPVAPVVPAAAPLGPRPELAPPSPEAEKRLAAKAPALELAGLTRREALELVGRLAAVGVQYDWEAFAPGELKLDDTVALKTADTTYDALFARLLEPLGARARLIGANISVGPASAPTATVDYPIDDLAGGDVAAAELYAGLIQLFVEPESWTAPAETGLNGAASSAAAKLVAAAGKLTVMQSPAAPREILAWLDRLRTARGKSTKGSPLSLESRVARAKPTLEKPMTMNFRPGVPLAEILAYLSKKAEASLSIDCIALADAGVSLDEAIGVAADKTPLGEVLAAICEPRDLDYRILDDRSFEITTRESLRRRGYVEFYDIRPLVAADISPVVLIQQLKTEFPEAGWVESGGVGTVRFDSASNRLIVRQHQDAQRRIERFLNELIAASAKAKAGAPAPAAPAGPAAAPLVNPAPSGSAAPPRGVISLPASRTTP